MNIKNVNFKIFIYFWKQLYVLNTGKCWFMYISVLGSRAFLEGAGAFKADMGAVAVIPI